MVIWANILKEMRNINYQLFRRFALIGAYFKMIDGYYLSAFHKHTLLMLNNDANKMHFDDN